MMDSIFANEIETIIGTCIFAIDELKAKGIDEDNAVLEVLTNFESMMEENGVRPDESQMMLMDLSAALKKHYHG